MKLREAAVLIWHNKTCLCVSGFHLFSHLSRHADSFFCSIWSVCVLKLDFQVAVPADAELDTFE